MDDFEDEDFEFNDDGEEIDAQILGGIESTLEVETRKLYQGEDHFIHIPKRIMDKNTKRRVQRLEKLNPLTVGYGGNSEGLSQVNQSPQYNPKYTQTQRGAGPKYLTPEQIYNGYFLWHLAVPMYNLEYLTELSTANAVHWACIKAKATNIVGLGHKWEPTNKTRQLRQDTLDDDKKSMKLARKLMDAQEKLDDIMESFNMTESFKDTLLKLWMDVEATGNGYMEVGRNRNGEVAYVGHIPSYTMRVRVPRDGFVQMLPAAMNKVVFFRNFGDTDTKDIFGNDPSPNEVIHFKKEHFKNAYYGVPDVISALPAIAGDKFAQEYNIEYFENKAVPRYALIIKGAKLSAASEKRILEYFRKEVKGKHHGTLYIPVPAGVGDKVDVQLTPIENQTQEASFMTYREANRTEIMLAHRVPASQIGVELSNLSQARESSQVFKDQVCSPEQERTEWKLNLIVKQFTDLFKFKFKQLNLIDEETQNRINDRNIRNGTVNPNEARETMGMAPRPGGEKYQDPGVKPTTDPEDPALGIGQGTGPGYAGGTPGPPPITTDGSPKNKSPMTPADQTSFGRAGKLAAQDKSGQAPRPIGK